MLYINNIYCQYSEKIPEVLEFTSTKQPIQKSDKSNVVLYVKEELPSFTIGCGLTTGSREEDFTTLKNLARKKDVVTVTQGDVIYDNLIISRIERVKNYKNIITFNITFTQIDTKQFVKTLVPLPAKLITLQKERAEGIQKVSEMEITPRDYPPISEDATEDIVNLLPGEGVQ